MTVDSPRSPLAPSPPSRALLSKLLLTIQQEKRVPWEAMARVHPELPQMPLYACRDAWSAQVREHGSATPLPSLLTPSSPHASATPVHASSLSLASPPPPPPPLFLCVASTGTGKSVLLPLFALDAHWAVLEQRLQRTLEVYDTCVKKTSSSNGSSNSREGHSTPVKKERQGQAEEWKASHEVQPFSLSSQATFIQEFTACSRLCIVVSQPTRVACVELARYVSALLNVQQQQQHHTSHVETTTTTVTSGQKDTSSATAPAKESGSESGGHLHAVHAQLLGKRVGFAVGGEACLCAETELIYATPGYLLNVFSTSSRTTSAAVTTTQSARPTVVLSPTTLMVDEAHCRDIETDALLAWLNLARQLTGQRRTLRQCCVMSATMRLTAMDDYLARPVSDSEFEGEENDRDAKGVVAAAAAAAEAEAEAEAAGPVGSLARRDALPLLLLSPAQEQHVQQWWLSAGKAQQRRPIDGVESSGTSDWKTQMQASRQTRRAVLQRVEETEGETYSVGDGVAPVSPRTSDLSGSNRSDLRTLSGSTDSVTPGGGEAGDDLPQGVVMSTTPYRVERFFIDDLDPEHGCFDQSHVLFDADTRSAVAALQKRVRHRYHGVDHSSCGSGSNAGGGALATSSSPHLASYTFHHLPLCLADEGRSLRQLLIHTFNNRPSSYQIFANQARLLASLVVEIMQAARQRWGVSSPRSSASAASSRAETAMPASIITTAAPAAAYGEDGTTAPITVLFFVAGISEMFQLVQALERICERVQQQQPLSPNAACGADDTRVTSSASVDVFRSGSELFSVGLLHASAVGSPQEQLAATARTGAPLRLLLATNVAESSLTIANTRVVIDTCLERRVRADEVTGTTRVQTAFASPSALRQRCGRVGRTGDGVVIHLAPRDYVLPPAGRTAEVLARPAHALTSRHVTSFSEDYVAASSELEPLADGLVTVLLHMKFFFPRNLTAALLALPSPPRAAELRVALQQLRDMELLVLPPPIPSTRHGERDAYNDGKESGHDVTQQTHVDATKKGNDSGDARGRASDLSLSSLTRLLNQSTFTGKGWLVASLPLPYEYAALVYHGFQFLCVEDAVLMACAMSVPTLFVVPRITAHSTIRTVPRRGTDSDFTWTSGTANARPALSPLEKFYQRLWMQRELAGFSSPATSTRGGKGTDGGVQEGAAKTAKDSGDDGGRRVGHLSEPLMLRAFLRRWYAASSITESVPLLNAHSINRAALRQVDSMVEQCSRRLIYLLTRHDTADASHTAETTSIAIPTWKRGEKRSGAMLGEVRETAEGAGTEQGDGEETDFSAYVSTAAAADTTAKVGPASDTLHHAAVPSFVKEWPDGVRDQLLRSLRRLKRAAVSRVHVRRSLHRRRTGLPQWHDSEERSIRLCSAPYVRGSRRSRATPHVTGARQRMQRYNERSSRERREDESGAQAIKLDEEEQRQQQAVRQHPSFIHWGKSDSPYPSLSATTTQPEMPATTTKTDVTAAPPPLRTHLTRARSPVYRPPPPPPPLPAVAFLFGRTEDRLSAAFVAAFGYRTMRGEDGGHRFHHRRLVRNLQALQQDADHVCTFHIDVQQQQQSRPTSSNAVRESADDADTDIRSCSQNAVGEIVTTTATTRVAASAQASCSTYEALAASGVTPQVIRAALEPYLAGTGLQQLEVFQSNRLAVAARFATSGFDNLLSEETAGASSMNKTEIADADAYADEDEDEDVNGSGADDDLGGSSNVSSNLRMTSKSSALPPTSHDSSAASVDKFTRTAEQIDAAPQARFNQETPSAENPRSLELLRPIPLSSMQAGAAATAPPGAPQSETGVLTAATLQDRSYNDNSRHPSMSRGSGVAGNPYVQLAPFGVSLLIAAVAGSGTYGGGLGGLQRIPLSIDTTSTAPLLLPDTTTTTTAAAAAAAQLASTHVATVSAVTAAMKKTATIAPVTPEAAAATTAATRRALRFASVSSIDTTVSWPDVFGTHSRMLRQADVARLGLGELFPTPAPVTEAGPALSTDDDRRRSTQQQQQQQYPASNSVNHTRGSGEAVAEVQKGTAASSSPTTFTLSVLPPVYITRSITWKVPLPVNVVLPSDQAHVSARTSHQRRPRRPPRTSLHYCVLCQHLCGSRSSFQQHCRTGSHLDHLYHAVQLGLSRAQLEQLYGYTAPSHEDENGDVITKTPAEGRHSGRRSRSSAVTSPSASFSATAAMPLISLLSLDNNNNLNRAASDAVSAGVPCRGRRLLTQQLHPCLIDSLSFLNCLQWTTRNSAATTTLNEQPSSSSSNVQRASTVLAEGDGDADRATPLAVAGSLVAMQATSDILAPPHLRARFSDTASPPADAAAAGITAAAATGAVDFESCDSTIAAAVPTPLTVAASTLSAHHVWVLDVSSGATTAKSTDAAPPPPMSLLFIIAGYLAAASPQAMVALLFNRGHTHLHGVMLYGLGAWRLPAPLPMAGYVGVLEHIGKGGGWPGLLMPIHGWEQPSSSEYSAQEIYDGLHWCAPTGSCRMCAATATIIAACAGEPKATGADTHPLSSRARAAKLNEHWTTVEATLLLTLHEYLQARRNVVPLADYVERVLRKLQLSPFLATADAATGSVSAAQLLADFMTNARGGQGIQSLLRDVGCTFITPPHALAALLHTGTARALPKAPHEDHQNSSSSEAKTRGKAAFGSVASRGTSSAPRAGETACSENEGGSAWSKRLSQRALGAEGATVELLFTAPPVLPSVLPPVDFADRLRAFYENRHEERWRAKKTVKDGAVERLSGRRSRVDGRWDDRYLF